jgi:hypothetical protein
MTILYEEQFTRVITRGSVLLRMRNVPDQSCRGKAPILFSVNILRKNRDFCGAMWKNLVQQIKPYVRI